MPRLEISVDTESREMSVRVNGQAVASVRSVEVYQYVDGDGDDDDDSSWQPRFSVQTSEMVDGVSRRVCLTASHRGRPAEGVASSRFPGLFEIHEDPISRAMAELVGRFRR